jgi:hypothetical protein
LTGKSKDDLSFSGLEIDMINRKRGDLKRLAEVFPP